jgi:AraC family transcriptional regulator
LTPLPENVLSVSGSRRSWNGLSIVVTDFHCAGRVVHRLSHATETRLSVLLEEVGSRCEPRLRENEPCPIGYMPKHMSFAPAGLEMWGYSDYTRFVKDATLSFDLAALGERLASEFDADAIATPRLRFADDRIWTLVKLLSDVVNDSDPSTQLYGDGLTVAMLLIRWSSVRVTQGPPKYSFSSRHLARHRAKCPAPRRPK